MCLLLLQNVTASMTGQTEYTYAIILMDSVFVLKGSVVPGAHNVKVWVISSLKMARVLVCNSAHFSA